MHNTKKKLADALKTLMEKKSFRKITIEELVTAAGMTRQSFYYHFEDIYALLAYLCQQEVQLWFEDCDESSFSAWLYSLLDRMEMSRELFRKIFDEIRAGQIHDYILDEVEQQMKAVITRSDNILRLKLETEEKQDFAAGFLSESIFWFYFMMLTKKITIGREEFVEQYCDFLTNIVLK